MKDIHTPGTIEYRRYGDWLIKCIEEHTGPLYDLGNLHNGTLESLYKWIVDNNPVTDYAKVT